MLRFKDPLRLPGGIRFSLIDHAYGFRRSSSWFGTEATSTLVTALEKVQVNQSLRSRHQSTTGLDERELSLSLRAHCFLHLESLPIPASAIFFQYLLLWRRLTSHYVSFYIAKCLLFGDPIKPIPVLQVSHLFP